MSSTSSPLSTNDSSNSSSCTTNTPVLKPVSLRLVRLVLRFAAAPKFPASHKASTASGPSSATHAKLLFSSSSVSNLSVMISSMLNEISSMALLSLLKSGSSTMMSTGSPNPYSSLSVLNLAVLNRNVASSSSSSVSPDSSAGSKYVACIGWLASIIG